MQDRTSSNAFEASLEFSLWALPATAASKAHLEKLKLPDEVLIDHELVTLPDGVDGAMLLLVDQSVPRDKLGLGVGRRLSDDLLSRLQRRMLRGDMMLSKSLLLR